MKLIMSELRGLPPEEQAKKIAEFCSTPPDPLETKEFMTAVDRIIAEFEEKHKMTSVEMRRRFCLGEIEATSDIDSWLFWYKLQLRYDGHENHR